MAITLYRTLDEAIVKAVRETTPATFHAIYSKVTDAVTRVVNGSESLDDRCRIVDRRLQALRKAGRLSFARATGWSVVETSV